jgi:hypothetical protein
MFPKTGNKLHDQHERLAIEALLAEALTAELGQTHMAVKQAMRWTGASERSVKHWLAGTHAPSARHLVELMRHSDFVLARVMLAAGRPALAIGADLMAVRGKLSDMLEMMDSITGISDFENH